MGNGGPDDNDAQAGRLVVAPALVKRYGKGTDSDATDTLIVAGALKRTNGRSGASSYEPGDYVVAAPLTSGGHPNSNAPGRRKEDDVNIVAGTVRSHTRPGSNASDDIVQGEIVRRLMPVECERLQGFPDGWTDLGGTPDTPRYSALGDAVTVNVAEWIGRRIVT